SRRCFNNGSLITRRIPVCPETAPPVYTHTIMCRRQPITRRINLIFRCLVWSDGVHRVSPSTENPGESPDPTRLRTTASRATDQLGTKLRIQRTDDQIGLWKSATKIFINVTVPGQLIGSSRKAGRRKHFISIQARQGNSQTDLFQLRAALNLVRFRF